MAVQHFLDAGDRSAAVDAALSAKHFDTAAGIIQEEVIILALLKPHLFWADLSNTVIYG